MQSTTGKLPAGKGHYGQSTSGQTSNGLSTTGNAMVGKIPRGQRDWQATYYRPQKVTLPLKSSPNVKAQIVFHHSKNYVLRSVVDPDIVALHPNIVNNNRLNPIDINYRDIFKTAAWHNGQKATKS